MELCVHVDLCEALLEDFLRQVQSPSLLQDASILEGLLVVAESLLAYLVQIEAFTPAVYSMALRSLGAAINATKETAQSLEGLLDNLQLLQAIPSRGRPKQQIAQGQLVELLQSHFSVVDMAKLFGCSPKTVYRRIHELGIMAALHSSLTDGDLDNIVQTFVLAHPNCG